MRVAIVGCGPAGAALATLLLRQGHRVTVLEQAQEPGPVGAGILLQHLGQQVLADLGVDAIVRQRSAPVRRVDVGTRSGRRVMGFGYADVPGAEPAWGVHRGTVFGALHGAMLDAADGRLDLRTGIAVDDVRPHGAKVEVRAGDRPEGVFDLVVGADGARSRVRAALRLRHRDHPYRYGALWAVVDATGLDAGDALYQCLDGTRRYLGVLPTGHQASVFWSLPEERIASTLDAGVDRWRDQARTLAGPHAPLLGRVTELLPARYRDVVVRRPYRAVGDRAGVVLVGDAAHAMSPQLGTGTSLALADVRVLVDALAAHPGRVADALADYVRRRRAHVRWYTWWSRLMMPLFQSDLDPLAWPRDLLADPVGRLPLVRRQLVTTLMGHRTSPWSTWTLPAVGPVTGSLLGPTSASTPHRSG